ncbi:MAG: hypothetical protein KatS3mg055_0917 [Chloroflexus sp.]|uniref:AAA family ATPase n=1 Tax=Chloroflexus sp. TaxID=1904827 RepID=UPI0021DE3215|nr:AAA family ATPase [Chloroflexus sp.]GIV88399.1 MAG: hypothetical protein KatS3mg055_0917 [Chloroflexus sp.]
MLTDVFAAAAEAVFASLLQDTGLADRVRAILGHDPERKAFQTALARVYTAVARQYPDLTAALFDKTFLTSQPATELLAQLLTRRGRPDPAELARRWALHLGHADPDRWDRLPDATRAAADVLAWLEAELAEQPVLQPLFDARALERIAENTAAIRRELEEALSRALTEAQKYEPVVQVAGNLDRSIVVTGDGNVVTSIFQTYFGGDYLPLADLYLPPDPVFRRVCLNDFVGRAWLEADLDRFLSEHDRGVWLLVGEAGVGKTTFLAHLVRERRYLHFFAEQAPGEAGVTRALQSLAAQLVSRCRLEPYASRDTLSSSQAAFPDFLERLLDMAAKRLTAKERLVIVIDALDEAGVGPNCNVLGLPKTLPLGVFLVLSQRPVSIPLRVDPYPQPVVLQAGDERNVRDVETYLRGVACNQTVAGQLHAHAYSEADFVRVLKEKSAGNWMYLQYVVTEIRAGRRQPLDLAQLPVGLAGYYAEYWGRWRKDPDWDRLYAPLLAALAAAHEAVTPEQLQRWTGLEVDVYRLKRLLKEEWAAFLYHANGRYRLYHASLRDFLRGAMSEEDCTPADRALVREMKERTRQAHRDIAEHYLQMAGGNWTRLVGTDEGYGLRHLGAHLADGERWEELYRVVALGEDRQPWAEARHAAEGNYSGYLADLELVWRWTEEEGKRKPEAVGRQVRCALIESSIHALAENIPPALLVAAVQQQVWQPPAALAYARHVAAPAQRAEALTMLIPLLPPELQGQVLHEALAAAQAIAEPADRAEALAALAPHLPPDQQGQVLHEALAAAKAIKDPGVRAEALAALAPHLPPDQQGQVLQQALAAAQAIRNPAARADALAALAPHLPADRQRQVLHEALAAAQAIENEVARAHALTALARHLPPALLPEALAAVRAIERESARARALAALAPHLPPALLQQALAAAQAIENEVARARALAALAPHLPPALLPEALAAAQAIRNPAARADALAALAPHLAEVGYPHEALAAAQAIKDPAARADALAALAPHLAEVGYPHEALAAAQAIKDPAAHADALAALAPRLAEVGYPHEALAAAQAIKWESARARALAALAPHLPPALLPKALAAAQAIADPDDRAEALAALAPHLPPALLPEALATAQAIADPDDRAEALAALAFRLAEVGYPHEALAAAQAIENDFVRARALTAIARHLPPARQGPVLHEALAAAQAIENEFARARALAALARHLPPALLPEALAAAQAIENDFDRAHALAALAPHLAEVGYPHEALAAAQAIKDPAARADALAALAPHLAEVGYPHEALAAAQAIKWEADRADALAALAPRLAEVGYPHEALAAAQAIENDFARAEALAALAPHLPPDQQGPVLHEALAAAQAIENDFARAEALAALVPHLPPDQQGPVLHEALAAAQAIENDFARAEALAALAPHLPPDQQGPVLHEALAAAQAIADPAARARALAALAPHLPPALLPEALTATQAIADPDDRARALAALAPHLPPDQQGPVLHEALAAAQAIEQEYYRAVVLAALARRLAEVGYPHEALAAAQAIADPDDRARALAALAPRWVAWAASNRPAAYDRWTETLRALSARPRPHLLADLRALAPVLAALGGAQAMVETFHAIQDGGRWWP